SSALAAYIKRNGLTPGRDIVFLISSDANHYGEDFSNVPFGEDRQAHARATALDRSIVQECLTGPLNDEKIESFTRFTWGKTYADQGETVWCGKYSIPMGLMTIRRTMAALSGKQVRAFCLRYSDTYTEGVLPLRDTGMGTTAPFSLKHWVGFTSIGLTTE
ncbi:MAG TPA: AmmeMemoRadiSam system protein B, partial [Bacteroidota bacterium]